MSSGCDDAGTPAGGPGQPSGPKGGQPLRAFIALGSNLGDSPSLLRRAMDHLQQLSDEPILKSSLWHSAPVDCPPGSPAFVNAAVTLVPRAGTTPESLLAQLQALEKEFGRGPKQILNEPRPLDLDLIAFGPLQLQRPGLILPHPRAHLRRFVLEPLLEIAPDFRLPGHMESLAELLEKVADTSAPVRLRDPDQAAF